MSIHNPRDELSRQSQAARDLLIAMKTLIDGDEDFAMDLVEGQTDLFEIVNVLAAQEGEDKAQALAIEHYIEKLIERRDRIAVRVEKRRNALLMAFQMAGITKPMRCPVATVSLRATPAAVITTDETRIPDEFWKPREPVLDKRALGAALKDGRQIPGAQMGNGGVSISIRMT